MVYNTENYLFSEHCPLSEILNPGKYNASETHLVSKNVVF
jgi:hypothetical protein